jgi:hypothetical protein
LFDEVVGIVELEGDCLAEAQALLFWRAMLVEFANRKVP